MPVQRKSIKRNSTKKRSAKKQSSNKRSVKKQSIKKRSAKKQSSNKRSVKKQSIKKRSAKKQSSNKRSIKKQSIKKSSDKSATIVKSGKEYKIKGYYINNKFVNDRHNSISVSPNLLYIMTDKGRSYWVLDKIKPRATFKESKLTIKISNKYKIVFKSLSMFNKIKNMLK
jgi:hypothetical protein